VESSFGDFGWSKNVNFDNFGGCDFDLSKFEQLSSPKFTKIQGSDSEIAKNDIFVPFGFTKV